MQWIRRWPWWAWALAAVLVVGGVVGSAFLLTGDADETTAPATTTTTPQPTTTTTSAQPTTTAPTTTTPPKTTTTTAKTTTTTPAGAVPGAVTAVAKPSGGSEEVQVDWSAVPSATGYRVMRTNATGGEARVVAAFDITTGRATAAPEVTAVWSSQHSYVPDRGPLTQPDQSPSFQYIDVGGGERCYRVVAYNAAGDGPLSSVTCGSPPGG